MTYQYVVVEVGHTNEASGELTHRLNTYAKAGFRYVGSANRADEALVIMEKPEDG